MTGEVTERRIHPSLIAKIVARYVAHHNVGADQIAEVIGIVQRALAGLGRPAEPVAALTPAVPVRRSVQHDFVTCLDCGWRGKMLRRHLATHHGLTSDDYLKRWSLPSDHALTAPAYSAQRSNLAKELGLGRANRVADTKPEAEAPRRRGRTRPGA